MNKKIILIVCTLFLIAIAGCKGSDKNKNPITDVDIRKGTDGLLMEFLPNAPPKDVFEDGSFPISLKLKNAGAFDIKGDIESNKKTIAVIEGGLLVLGFEKAYVGIIGAGEDRQEFGIKGKSVFNPLGDEEFISINAEARKIGEQSETHPSAIFATACYPYQTILGASVCIDPDVLGQNKGLKACAVKDLDFKDGQGAPVAVTKIETRMLPQDNSKIKPHFIIHVKNAGNGQVIKNGKEKVIVGGVEKDGTKEIIEKACSSESLSYKDFNVLKVKAILSGVVLDCDPKELMQEIAEVRLREKEDIIRCTYEGADLNGDGVIDNKLVDGKRDIEAISSGLDAYVAPLKVEFDYGYTFTISKNIIIEKVLKH